MTPSVLALITRALLAIPIARLGLRGQSAALQGACSGIVIASCALIVATGLRLVPQATPTVIMRRATLTADPAPVGALGATVWFATRRIPPRVARFPLTTASADALSINFFDRDLAITPDGSSVVYVGRGGAEILMRSLDRVEPTVLARVRSAMRFSDRSVGALLEHIAIDGM